MRDLLTVKLWRDLRATRGRLALMIVAVAVTSTVFSAVLFTRAVTAREIALAYQDTVPASATIVLDEGVATDRLTEIAEAARRRPGVVDAAARSQFTSQVQDRQGGQWQTNPIQVFVVPAADRLTMARFDIEQGNWPPSPGEIFIERDALPLLGVTVGDTITIRSEDGTPARLRVSGVVHDASLAPPPQEQKSYGYVSAASTVDEVKLRVSDGVDREQIATIGRDVAAWMEAAFGLTVREIQVPRPDAHPHQGQLDAILFAMLAFGAAAVVLSGIVVATMLNGIFTQQIPQIGVMKAVGLTTGLLARRYVLAVLLVAGTATLVAVPLAALISRVWAPAILTLLGMKAESLASPWWSYAVAVAVGLVLPVLLALPPLLRASRISVRAAIDHRGVVPAGRLSWLPRGLVGRLDRVLLVAVRNSTRRRARFLLSTGLLAAAGALFVAGLSTVVSVQAVPDQARQQRGWDVELELDTSVATGELIAALRSLPGVERVEGWSVVPTGISEPNRLAVTRTYPDQGHGSVAVTAIPTDTKMYSAPKLLEGRWLRPGETGAVVLNQIARANTLPGLRAGDTIELTVAGRPTTWRIVGIAEEIFVGSGIYTTPEGYTTATGLSGVSNVVRITTARHDEATRLAVANAADRTLADASIGVVSATSVGRWDAAGTGHMLPIIAILLAIALAMGVVGCIGLASAMSSNVLERLREFGVMHAIGAPAGMVRRVVVAEGVVVALVSCLAAVAPTLWLARAMSAGLGNLFMYTPLPFRVSALAAGVWLAVVVGGAMAATAAPARRASRLTVRQALAYQ